MSIIDKIRRSVETATGLPFHYDTPQTLNMTLDHAVFPCAMLHILQQGAIVDANGVLRERLTIEVLFAQTSSLDFDGVTVEREELNLMKLKAFEWLLYLMRKERELRLISLNGTNRYYATDDAILSAFGVNITIDEAQGISECTFRKDDEIATP